MDSIHSTLEGAVRNVDIFSPDEYITLTKMACQSQPYKCYSLGTNDCPVFDVREFAAKTMINCNVYHKSEGKSKKVSWMKAKMIYHGKFVGSTGPSCLGFVSSFHYDEEIIVVDTAGVTRTKSK